MNRALQGPASSSRRNGGHDFKGSVPLEVAQIVAGFAFHPMQDPEAFYQKPENLCVFPRAVWRQRKPRTPGSVTFWARQDGGDPWEGKLGGITYLSVPGDAIFGPASWGVRFTLSDLGIFSDDEGAVPL